MSAQEKAIAPKCAGCKKRIPESETDYVLQHLEGGHPRHYHASCAPAALSLILRNPSVWILTERTIDEEAN
jgi:hypothetical protein